MKQKDLSPLGLYAGRDEGQKYPHDDIIKKKNSETMKQCL